MKDKVMSADQAAALVTSGIHLGVGAGMEMNPMPVVREVIRNKVTGLTLTPLLTGGYVADLLIGAGCVDEIQFPQVVMDEFGLAPNFRKRAESGRLAMRESMCPVLLAGLQAGAHGLPFTPVLGVLNTGYTDILREYAIMTDPFSGDDYVVVPAVKPDAAIVHGFVGDRFGGVVLDSTRNDRLLAMAAKKTIVVVEKIVEPEEVLCGPHGVYLSAIHVDAVVEAPGGAHPTGCRGHYPMDAGHLFAYMEAAKDEAAFKEYLDRFILGPANHDEYLDLVGREAVQ